jgi:hypothetical protein
LANALEVVLFRSNKPLNESRSSMNSAQESLKKKQALGRNRPVMKTVSAIPTAHMDADIAGCGAA